MTDDEALGSIRTVLNESLGVPPGEVVPSANLRDDLELDSIDLTELLGALETVVQQSIGTERVAGVETIADVVDLIRRLAERPGA